MSRRAAQTGIAFGTFMIVGLMAVGCSSSSTASGSGGSTAAGSGGGTATGSGGGTAAGSGGTTGNGSGGTAVNGSGGATATGAGGASVPLSMVCAATVKNKGTCATATDMPCANSCGPSKAGFKNCNCLSNVWDCPKCEYVAGDYACYKLPVPLAACPADPTDPTGLMLVASGGACTAPSCAACGSPTVAAYRDSANTPKTGYCVCVPGTGSSKWSCASVAEWPPQQ